MTDKTIKCQMDAFEHYPVVGVWRHAPEMREYWDAATFERYETDAIEVPQALFARYMRAMDEFDKVQDILLAKYFVVDD